MRTPAFLRCGETNGAALGGTELEEEEERQVDHVCRIRAGHR